MSSKTESIPKFIRQFWIETEKPFENKIISKSDFIALAKHELEKLGYTYTFRLENEPSDYDNIASYERLSEIYDMRWHEVHSKHHFLKNSEEIRINMFPCWELKNSSWEDQTAIEKRLKKRWVNEGGKLHDGRMIALKSDPIWFKISDFSKPWQPFSRDSIFSFTQIDVSRNEAEKFEIIGRRDRISAIECEIHETQEENIYIASNGYWGKKPKSVPITIKTKPTARKRCAGKNRTNVYIVSLLLLLTALFVVLVF